MYFAASKKKLGNCSVMWWFDAADRISFESAFDSFFTGGEKPKIKEPNERSGERKKTKIVFLVGSE